MSRYSRQILFPEIGEDGQEKIRNSSILVVGCGALGTVVSESMVRAGVGKLAIVDRDFVEMSNLQRQVLFDEEDAFNFYPKAYAAEMKLKKINSEVEIKGIIDDFSYLNAPGYVEGIDLILDGTDNFETRFLINDASLKYRIPWIYGACVGSSGLTMTIIPGMTPCLRCVFESAPLPGLLPTCDTAGVISPVVNIIAAFQVSEALKILSKNIDAVNKSLISIDVWNNSYYEAEVASLLESSDCIACKKGEYEYLNSASGSQTTVLCGRDSVQITQIKEGRIDFSAVSERLKGLTEVKQNKFLLQFNVEGFEVTLFTDGRAIVKGTKEAPVAKNIYSKYVGN